eukprot:TRINITY_DN12409_c0_g1_i1.p1 TRINITY_DN12409_c0_g1~~TRINITY_DN12409_c0_g1_i1.p1  ORF type:complete len:118 (-),score=7.36 TRINITY_DN12409_c0_g1_i1:528-881(-)
MKSQTKEFIKGCLVCQKINVAQQKPTSFLKPLQVLSWKWDEITVDFITGLPKIVKHHDTNLVCVDRLTKMTHLIPTKTTTMAKESIGQFIGEIFKLHDTPRIIISDHDPKFVSNFWQ